ncbi:unnamed protein product [Symbiodinium sp. CCMP2592]|nr:unnamed protein product [Symbiodinium sp. CCMP2592]
MRAGAPDPWALQEAILKEERLFDDHRTMIQAGEDVRRTARMNPKELKYMSKTASVPSFRSTLTVRDRTFLREFHERPRKAQQLDVYAPYAAIFEEPVDTEYRRSFSGRLPPTKGSKGAGLASTVSLGALHGPRRDLQAAVEARLSAAPFGVVMGEVPRESTLRSSFTLRDTQWPPAEGRTRIG